MTSPNVGNALAYLEEQINIYKWKLELYQLMYERIKRLDEEHGDS